MLSCILYSRGLQTTACGPNLACEAIPSSHKDILSIMTKNIYEAFVDLVEYTISQNNYIT